MSIPTSATSTSSVIFGRSTPILRVANLEASVAYYTTVLGFTLDWRNRLFGQVTRGSAPLMLSQGDQGHAGSWVYVGVSDADALVAEIQPRGAIVRHPPTNYPWGARELHVSDPDGNVLRFGSDAVPGQPIGDWIDGDGVTWAPQPDGSWRAAT
jgi:catechol 2,3-dioxygenase-like lactoylglutathione lyase family enzyme